MIPSSQHVGDLEACRILLRAGSKSFHAASLLLPSDVRPSVWALYAFCRVADDEVDGAGSGAVAVAQLRRRLVAAYAGTPQDNPVDRAFATMVAQYQIPFALPAALIEGFEWDVAGRVCETFSDTCAYGVRVAGTVGVMMSLIMGVTEAEALSRANDLGVAMQLTNIARDVGEDARLGRLYLPRQWFYEEGIDPDQWLASPRFLPQIARMVRRLLQEAEYLYARAEQGIALLPIGVRPAIWSARYIYSEIGREIAQANFDSVTRRAIVSHPRKAILLGKAMAVAAVSGAGYGAAPLPEGAFLVQAAARPRPVRRTRIDNVIDIFERLEQRDRERHAAQIRKPLKEGS
jgi:phytoene synthase